MVVVTGAQPYIGSICVADVHRSVKSQYRTAPP
jgi:hypothetical protein